MKARKLLGRGCKEFLCNIVETETIESFIKDIPVLREFPDAFSMEIPCMPPLREVEFCIDLIPGATLSLRHPIK